MIDQKIKKLAKPMLYASILTMAIGIGSASAKEKQLPERNYFTDWGIVDTLGYAENIGHHIQLGDLDGDGDLDIVVITGKDAWNAESIIKIYENRIPQKNK